MVLRLLQLAVATTLLVAAGGKLVAPGELAGALRASRVVPRSFVHVVSGTVVALEIALAVAVLAADGKMLAGAFAASALLAAGFAVWGTSVKVRGIKLRCACFGGASKDISWWTVARASALSAAAVLGIASADAGASLLEGGTWAIASATGYAICVLLLTGFVRTRSALLLTGESLHSLQSLSGEVRT